MLEEKLIAEPVPEKKVKRTRKKRGPMTPEAKAILLERLAAGRAKKKAQKLALEGKKVEEPAPVPAPAPVQAPVPAPIKKVRIPTPPPKVDTELLDMKKQLEALRATNKKQERELIKQAIAQEKTKKQGLSILKKNTPKKLEPIEEDKAVTMEQLATPPPVKKRYSTYKKSIWSKFE